MSFTRLGEILEKVRKRHPKFAQRLTEAQALSRWEQAVGPQIAKHSQAIGVEDGVLKVEVNHPIWRSELHHRKAQILEILNGSGEGGERTVLKDILFVDPRKSSSRKTQRGAP
jgi:predicted nucleic acid-binding Zn ribbon protein